MGEDARATARIRGRSREWTRIVEVLAQVARGEPSLLVIQGPPGIGKTRLLREIAATARRRRWTVIEHRGWIRAPAVARMTSRRQRLGGHVPVATGAGCPTVVVWDDPPWVDPDLIRSLAATPASAPILWALTRRTGATTRTAELAGSSAIVTVELGPLPEAAIAATLAQLLGAAPSVELLALAGAAAGNPGVVAELVSGLREEGLIDIGAGAARLVSARLPRRMGEVVRRRLDELSAPARRLVQVAAAAGPSLRLLELAGRLRDSAAGLLPAVEEALASGLLVCTADQLAFSHELVRLVVADSLPELVRNALRQESDRTHAPSATAPAPADTTPAPPPAAATGWDSLTETERRIAGLISQGMTNTQIATRTLLSHHTVNYHLRQIFRKLDIHSRVKLASVAAAHLADGRVTAGRDVAAAPGAAPAAGAR